MKSHNEVRIFQDLEDKRDAGKSRLAVLNELLMIMNQEQNALKYPKHMKFGFISFLVLAALGVFVPLIYATWSEDLISLTQLPIDINGFVLVLFSIGLSLNFIYNGMELLEARSVH